MVMASVEVEVIAVEAWVEVWVEAWVVVVAWAVVAEAWVVVVVEDDNWEDLDKTLEVCIVVVVVVVVVVEGIFDNQHIFVLDNQDN